VAYVVSLRNVAQHPLDSWNFCVLAWARLNSASLVATNIESASYSRMTCTEYRTSISWTFILSADCSNLGAYFRQNAYQWFGFVRSISAKYVRNDGPRSVFQSPERRESDPVSLSACRKRFTHFCTLFTHSCTVCSLI